MIVLIIVLSVVREVSAAVLIENQPDNENFEDYTRLVVNFNVRTISPVTVTSLTQKQKLERDVRTSYRFYVTITGCIAGGIALVLGMIVTVVWCKRQKVR